MALLTPLNVNCHASDGRKVRLFLPRHPPSHACHIYTYITMFVRWRKKMHPLSANGSTTVQKYVKLLRRIFSRGFLTCSKLMMYTLL